MEWQPIETAPVDVDVLVTDGSDTQCVARNSTLMESWQLTYCGSFAEDGDLCFEPTHWMPLPPPPKTK